jgi:hypothetical protein
MQKMRGKADKKCDQVRTRLSLTAINAISAINAQSQPSGASMGGVYSTDARTSPAIGAKCASLSGVGLKLRAFYQTCGLPCRYRRNCAGHLPQSPRSNASLRRFRSWAPGHCLVPAHQGIPDDKAITGHCAKR